MKTVFVCKWYVETQNDRNALFRADKLNNKSLLLGRGHIFVYGGWKKAEAWYNELPQNCYFPKKTGKATARRFIFRESK
jgi:hypothetical protein